jgi:hypothetical protein
MNFRKSIKRKIELSQSAYAMYLNSRSYISALKLMLVNKNCIKTILDYAGEFDENEWGILVELINHWSGWLIQFEFEEKIQQPSLNDKFIFERSKDVSSWPFLVSKLITEW